MSDTNIVKPVSELFNWSRNPRAIDRDKFEELKKRIKRFGQIKPLIVTPEGEVLGGNMRLRAMASLGITDAWVSVVNPKTEAEKIEIALTENEEMGYYQEQELAELISEYKDEINLGDYSIHLGKLTSLDDLLQQFTPVIEDEVPEVSDDPAVSVLGEIYQLGRHRLMCGDSTDAGTVTLLMNGQKADMVFTDPPYGMDLDTDYTKMGEKWNKKHSRVIGDEFLFNIEDYLWIDCSEQIWFGANYYAKTLPNGGSWFVWDKREDENFDKMFGSGFEIAWSKTPHKQEIVRCNATLFGKNKQDVKGVHPTQKPLQVCSWFISKLSKLDNIVLDLFLGSGSTLIACEQTNRTCYGMELDPKYCDVIRKRYAKFIGKEQEWQEETPKI